jgi:hypothetical protein
VPDGKGLDQPTCQGERNKCRKKSKNSNADVMYICVPCVSCNVVMLFTCLLVKSHLDSKEVIRCETRPIEINSKILGWAW